VVSAARALMEIGVFEAIPAHGSIGVAELAGKCEADEALIGIYHLSPMKLFSHLPATVRLMRQLTAAGIFAELKIAVWAHNRLSLLLSNHPEFTGKYFFEIS
jgi:hypothetical protein